MPSAGTFSVGLFLACCCFSAVTCSSWWWNEDIKWSDQKPTNCPHEDTYTHVCSSLVTSNFTCITIACCDYFEKEQIDYHDGDYESREGEDDVNIYYIGRIDKCRVCYSVKACTLHSCYDRCCDGYTFDHHGRCRNKTDELVCENGGRVEKHHDYYSQKECHCPANFTGHSCEIPVCNCTNGGECEIRHGNPHCTCQPGYYGAHCENASCSPACKNGGTCVRDGDYQYCVCKPEFVGDLCEQSFHSNPQCPGTYRYTYQAIGERCYNDDECPYGSVCCRQGNSTVCVETVCKHDGQTFEIGETMSVRDCLNCVCGLGSDGHAEMQCRSKVMEECAIVAWDCENVVQRPDECCPRCEDTKLKCPSNYQEIWIETLPDKMSAVLTMDNTGVTVSPYHMESNLLFDPPGITHCRCLYPYLRKTKVHAYINVESTGELGCHFYVTLVDREPPRFTSCPDNVYVFENELAKWSMPTFEDNVGILYKTKHFQTSEYLAVGNHTKVFRISDYDGNKAMCVFNVVVVSKDTPMDQLPVGMRNRAESTYRINKLTVIVAPVVGGLIFLALVLIMVCIVRRVRNRPNATTGNQPERRPGYADSYENNVYAIPGDVYSDLPGYNDVSFNPPAYHSIGGLDKGSGKGSIKAPPSYSNAGYEDLPKVHNGSLSKSSVVPSVKSEK